MTAQLHPFEHSVQEARLWLKDVEEQGGLDPQASYHALRGVLHTLRDTLVPQEAVHLSQQLPHFVTGLFFEGYQPAQKPDVKRRADRFLGVVHEQLDAANQTVDPRDATKAVFGVLDHRLSEGQAEQVKHMLHREVQAIWEEAA